MYAQKFGQDTPLPSIQLCIESVDAFGRVRLRLCLRVCGHHQLGVADAAAADDHRSAAWPSRCCSAMAQRRRNGSARQQANGSILDWHRAARRAMLQKGLGPSDRSRLNELSGRRSRDRAAHSEDREIQFERRGAGAAGGSDRRAGFVRRAREADVRPAGAGVHDRHHARARRSR